MDDNQKVNYEKITKDARLKTLELIYRAGTSHIGSNFSAIDIMAVLFEKADIKKDEVILSAGWKAAAWYYFLFRKGIIAEEELNSFCQPDSKFIGLVEPMNRWGLRFAGGSMGYGLPFAVGVALAKKMKREEGNVYCLMSEGEMAIGTTWEASRIALHHNLDNLSVLVDHNGLQAMGLVGNILKAEETDVFKEWCGQRMDGHDYKKLEIAVNVKAHGVPTYNIFNTIKGKGVSFMENNNDWHYRKIDNQNYELAKKELGQ